MKCRLLFTYLKLELRSASIKILDKISLQYSLLQMLR